MTDLSGRQYRNFALIRSELDDQQMTSLFSQKIHHCFSQYNHCDYLTSLSKAQTKIIAELNKQLGNTYRATLHDAMRVANGMNLVNRTTLTSDDDLGKLWIH